MIRRRLRVVHSMIDQAEYIGKNNAPAADPFLSAVEETLRHLEQFPGSGHPHTSPDRRLKGIRAWSVQGFRNYLIFYRKFDGGIEALHLIHGARDVERVSLAEFGI